MTESEESAPHLPSVGTHSPSASEEATDWRACFTRRRVLVAVGTALGTVPLAGCGERDAPPEGAGDDEILDNASDDDGTDGTNTDGGETSDGDGETGDDGGEENDENDGEDDEEPSGPVAAVETYYVALNNGELATVKDLAGTDSPLAEGLPDDPDTFEENANAVDIELLEATVIQRREDGRAVVETTVEARSDRGVDRRTLQIELRREDGEWRLWGETDSVTNDIELPDVDGQPIEVFRTYLVGYTTGDRETLERVIHPDSPRQQSLDETDDESLDQTGNIISDYRLESVTVADQSDDRLVLDVAMTVIALGEPNDESGTVELRPKDGEWRIWDENVL